MPDNAIYYHAAYIAATVVYGAYIVSIFIRTKRARDRQERENAQGVAHRG